MNVNVHVGVLVVIGIALAYVVSAVAPHMDAANAMLPVYSVIALFFTGILIRRQDMPDAWRYVPCTLPEAKYTSNIPCRL